MSLFQSQLAYEQNYPDVPFGLALITGCRNFENPDGFDAHKRKLLRKMRKRETLALITDRIDLYQSFFAGFGFPCPLPEHLKRTINSGFPRYNLMVDAHFLAEMCAGILVAVTDYDRFQGALTLDVAVEGENFLGMGQREMQAKDREIVLRDEKGIVCILCQGADEKNEGLEEDRECSFLWLRYPRCGRRVHRGWIGHRRGRSWRNSEMEPLKKLPFIEFLF